MNWLHKLIQKIRCNHEYKWVRNIYGDEINSTGGKRSIWKCFKCNKIQYRNELKPEGKLFAQELDRYYYQHYNEQYNEWVTKNEEQLEEIKEDMINAAKRGECWHHVIYNCTIENNDKEFYEKYFKSLGLKVDYRKLNGEPYGDATYDFTLKWDN